MAVKLTRYEMNLMEALWCLGKASVREVQEALPKSRRGAYTTIQTMIYRLEEKGAVRRVKKIGNAWVFEAAVSKSAAYRRLMDEFLTLFGGSARPLMAHLVESGKLTLEEIHEAEEMLKQQRGQGARP